MKLTIYEFALKLVNKDIPCNHAVMLAERSTDEKTFFSSHVPSAHVNKLLGQPTEYLRCLVKSYKGKVRNIKIVSEVREVLWERTVTSSKRKRV